MLFIRFTANAFCKLLFVDVFSCFPIAFVDRMWDLIVSVPDHCLSFYFSENGRISAKIRDRKAPVSRNILIGVDWA